jgi:hypothetical protein
VRNAHKADGEFVVNSRLVRPFVGNSFTNDRRSFLPDIRNRGAGSWVN